MKLQYLNYKEPLRVVENGYGYVGALGQTENGGKVQCHVCGELFYNLGSHVVQSHKLRAREYREKYGLGRRTPLCSDQASAEYKARAVARWEGKTPKEQDEQIAVMRAAAAIAPKTGKQMTAEEQNRLGICPDQLIDRITVLADKLGRSPSYQEFCDEYGGRFIAPIKRTFGSWAKAKDIAGLPVLKTGPRNSKPWNKARFKYSREELIVYIQEYVAHFKVPPTATDWNRGFLPDIHAYYREFGSLGAAREAAGYKGRFKVTHVRDAQGNIKGVDSVEFVPTNTV